MLGRCHRYKGWVVMLACVITCRRQRLHGRHGSHRSNGCHRWVDIPTITRTKVKSCALKVSPIQVMGGDVGLCNHLQALAASRATREPPVKQVSRVGGHSYHHMKQFIVSCLGDVIHTSDGW